MKENTILLAVLFLFGFAPMLHAKTTVTVYCDNNYPPYSYVENGETRGIYVEVLTKAFSRMEAYEVTIIAEPWKRSIKMLEQGKYFALFPPYYRPKARPFMDYSAPILEEKLVVFLNESTAKKRQLNSWPVDFNGMKIGRNAGFTISQNEDFLEAVSSGRITLEDAKDNRSNILKLAMGRVDAYVNDRLSILWELSRLKKSGEYEEGGRHEKIVEGITLSVEQGYLGFTNQDKGVFTFKEDFIKTLNKIILDMKEKGEIEKIILDSYTN